MARLGDSRKKREEAAPASRPHRHCLECGAALKPAARDFCAAGCRKAFGNRRMLRGAELYDLFMAHRYDRENAKQYRALTMMNRMAAEFWREDQRRRQGRPSWRPPAAVLAARADLKASAYFAHPVSQKKE